MLLSAEQSLYKAVTPLLPRLRRLTDLQLILCHPLVNTNGSLDLSLLETVWRGVSFYGLGELPQVAISTAASRGTCHLTNNEVEDGQICLLLDMCTLHPPGSWQTVVT